MRKLQLTMKLESFEPSQDSFHIYADSNNFNKLFAKTLYTIYQKSSSTKTYEEWIDSLKQVDLNDFGVIDIYS